MMENFEKAVVTIGIFDGVHRGHQKLLRRTEELARESGATSVAYTFSDLPQGEDSESSGELIFPLRRREEFLHCFVDTVHVENFSEVSDLSPAQFVDRILREKMSASAVVVGSDWRFGKGRKGDIELLEELSDGEFAVEVVQQFRIDGKPVSSSWIRKELRNGNIETAAKLLGRKHSLYGQVVRGSQIGRELGYPTANISIDPEILVPRKGVYAVIAEVNQLKIRGLLYIGNRPTLDKQELRIEVYLMDDFTSEIYGQEVTVHLLKYLRDEKNFESEEKLRRAISDDVREAKQVIKPHRPEDLEPCKINDWRNEKTGEDQYV